MSVQSQLRDARGRFAPQGKGRSKQARTRIKLLGGELTYKQDGYDEAALIEAFEETKRRAVDMRPVWLEFQDIWFAQNEEMFDSEGIPEWAALSPDYEHRKYAEVGDLPILQYSGRLKESLTSLTNDTIWNARPRSIQMGTAVPYSPMLEAGTDNMPARPHLNVLLPETFAGLMEIAEDYVTQELEPYFRES